MVVMCVRARARVGGGGGICLGWWVGEWWWWRVGGTQTYWLVIRVLVCKTGVGRHELIC